MRISLLITGFVPYTKICIIPERNFAVCWCLSRKRSITSANAVIVNQNISQHQFRLSIRWEAAYSNQLLITSTVSYSNTYIVPMGAFCGTLISFPEWYVTSAMNSLITDTFPDTSFHLSTRWEAAYAIRYLITSKFRIPIPGSVSWGIFLRCTYVFSERRYMISVDTVIDNQYISQHQFRLSTRWEAAYANRLLITGTVLYSDICIWVSREC